MMKQYQVTLFCASGSYKPVSCIITKENEGLTLATKEEYIKDIKTKGIQKICHKRYWSAADLKKYGYSIIKVRELA